MSIIAGVSEKFHLLCAARLVLEKPWELSCQKHPNHEMTLIVSGAIEVSTGKETRCVGAGHVLFYPSGFLHTEKKMKGRNLLLHGLSFQGPDGELTGGLVTRDRDGRLLELSRWLIDEWVKGDHPVQASFFSSFLQEWQRLQRPDVPEEIRAVRDHIRQHIHRTLSLDELARVAGLSKFHFIRWYQKHTGKTPAMDVMIIRTDVVRQHLLTTHLPLKEIAALTGFSDPYHMSKVFLRYQGIRPGALRKPGTITRAGRYSNRIIWAGTKSRPSESGRG